jgi:SAM-dependent methyltransferase
MNRSAGSAATDARAHWERVYTRKDPRSVGWYEPVLERSLALIGEAGLDRDAPIIDVGGGASTLAATLLDAGYTDVSVADISPASLQHARRELGADAERIAWIEADVRKHDFGRSFALWHDRAAFHFMVDAADRAAYLDVLEATLSPGGHVVIASFGPHGPTHCSGLPTMRYGAAELAELLGDGYKLVSSCLEQHRMPSGAEQQFMYAHLRHRPFLPRFTCASHFLSRSGREDVA